MEEEHPKVLPKHVKDMSQDELDRALKKKKECDAKSLSIVAKMIDNPVDRDWFLSQLKHIRQSHFQDVIEERAITKCCGYPLCCEKIKEMPAQRYRISLKTNRVYDTTERKKFCSNFCYKAANFLENQLLTSPLWFDSGDTTVYTLLPMGFKGSVGTEIGLEKDCIIKPLIEKEFTSINQIALDSLAEITPNTVNNMESEKMQEKHPSPKPQDNNPVIETQIVEEIVPKTVIPSHIDSDPDVGPAFQEHKTPERQTVSVSKPPDSKLIKPRRVASTPPSAASLVSHIEKCLREWINIETLIHLFGEKSVKEKITAKGGSVKEYNKQFNDARSMWDPTMQDRYDKICKRLSLMELEDEIFDGEMQGPSTLKPLPDYRDIQEDGKTLVLKVGAFYQGKLTYPEKSTSVEETIADSEEAAPENMPLVDSHSQKALRRKLVVDRLKRVLSDWAGICGVATNNIMTQVRGLVATFSLEAHNITFNPLEWRLLGLIIVDMLALKDPLLKSKTGSKQGQKYQTPILASFRQDQNYTRQLLTSVMDLDNLLHCKKRYVSDF